MTEHQKSTALALYPRDFGELAKQAEYLSHSRLLPPDLRKDKASVALQIATGMEIGLPPMASIRSIHVINGRPSLGADAMVAAVLSSGLCKYFRTVQVNDESAVVETHRVGAPAPERAQFSMKDAKRAGLIKKGGNWEKYPSVMLLHRARAFLARRVYPDVLAGVYTPDEAREFGGDLVIDAEIVPDGEAEKVVRPNGTGPTDKALVDKLEAAIGAADPADLGMIVDEIATRHEAGELSDAGRGYLLGAIEKRGAEGAEGDAERARLRAEAMRACETAKDGRTLKQAENLVNAFMRAYPGDEALADAYVEAASALRQG